MQLGQATVQVVNALSSTNANLEALLPAEGHIWRGGVSHQSLHKDHLPALATVANEGHEVPMSDSGQHFKLHIKLDAALPAPLYVPLYRDHPESCETFELAKIGCQRSSQLVIIEPDIPQMLEISQLTRERPREPKVLHAQECSVSDDKTAPKS
eukprot:SM000040S14872  [mRNA]  locus=s40:701835:709935:- [translate_table: standard]